jgi:hypothetical protein
MIKEALSWPSGTRDSQNRVSVDILPDGTEFLFLKPGKEVFNDKRPNPNDMTPQIGIERERYNFEDIWNYLAKISMVDFDAFKAVLTLVYRNAYLVDHVREGNGVRYRPSRDILSCIDELASTVGHVLPNGLLGMMHFLNILGWNEDMKYQTESNFLLFNPNHKTDIGRINTLLSCIRVPYQAAQFAIHVLDNRDKLVDIDFGIMLSSMQQFSRSRGTCTPSKPQLVEWLSPYIVDVKSPRHGQTRI